MTRTELLLSTYKPQLAIMVYKSDTDQYYLESHDVNKAGEILAGKPLAADTISSMVDVFFDERQNRVNVDGFIPENVLAFRPEPGGHYAMVWYRPAEVRMMHFAPQLKLKSTKTWIPAMVYMVSKKDLFVYALKSNVRPEMKTKLFRAPFHNVSDQGHVCLGSAKVKKPVQHTYESLMKYWEDLFWLSEFSHLNGASNPTKSDIAKVYKQLLASKAKLKWSELDELKPLGNSTLKSLFR